MTYNYKPVVLVILDGWGEWDTKMGNPLANAHLPTIDHLNAHYPKLLLEASGLSVGLPWGVFGNSEVGHQTIGSGQIIYHYLPTITASIHSGTFFRNPVLLDAMATVKKNGSKLHLLGLASGGGVHSHIDHLYALLEMAKRQGINKVFIHALTDGRDTPTNVGVNFISEIVKRAAEIGVGRIASLAGRYYTMDRNRNWDRLEKAVGVYVRGEGIKAKDPVAAIQEQYRKKLTDEYLEPTVIVDENDKAVGLIENGDVVINFNFRADRARQISHVFCATRFDKFKNPELPQVKYYGFTQYEKSLPMPVVFPPQEITTRVAEILAHHNKRQLRISEMEKFAHVTYFFNGGVAEPFPGEDRIFVPSKNAPSYATVPEMSAYEVSAKLSAAIKKNKYDFILVNYANPDMVGHTGDFKAGIRAVEVVDGCLGKLIAQVFEAGGCLLVTADHGNIEEMVNLETGQIDTQHSNNPVPFWLVTPDNKKQPHDSAAITDNMGGMIADVAPTVLRLLNIQKPKAMIGVNLLEKI